MHPFNTAICSLFHPLCLLPSSFPRCCFKESGPGCHPANISQASLMSCSGIHVRTKDQWKGHDTPYQIGHQYQALPWLAKSPELGQNSNIRMRNGSEAPRLQGNKMRSFTTYWSRMAKSVTHSDLSLEKWMKTIFGFKVWLRVLCKYTLLISGSCGGFDPSLSFTITENKRHKKKKGLEVRC